MADMSDIEQEGKDKAAKAADNEINKRLGASGNQDQDKQSDQQGQ